MPEQEPVTAEEVLLYTDAVEAFENNVALRGIVAHTQDGREYISHVLEGDIAETGARPTLIRAVGRHAAIEFMMSFPDGGVHYGVQAELRPAGCFMFTEDGDSERADPADVHVLRTILTTVRWDKTLSEKKAAMIGELSRRSLRAQQLFRDINPDK